MYIIFIKSSKRKVLLITGIIGFSVWMYLFSNLHFVNNLLLKITINNYLSFSCPFRIEVDNIFINQQFDSSSVETSSTQIKPLTRTFSNYKSLDGKFSFQYPSAFILNQQNFSGSEILYHIDFHNKQNTTHGFVQVWNLPYSLEEFLTASKSVSRQTFKYFASKKITVNGLSGFLWDYAVITKEGKAYKNLEAFLQKDARTFRISYFVPEELWNNEQSDIFWRIVRSLKTY